MIFSATGRAALARVSVVVMRPCSNKFVTRLRSVARRCHGLRPSFDPDFKCRIVLYSYLFDFFYKRTFGSGKNPGADAACNCYSPAFSSAGGGAVWLGS